MTFLFFIGKWTHCQVDRLGSVLMQNAFQFVLKSLCFLLTLRPRDCLEVNRAIAFEQLPLQLVFRQQTLVDIKAVNKFQFEVLGIKFNSDSIWTTSSWGQRVKFLLAQTVLHFYASLHLLPCWPSPGRALLMNGVFVVHTGPVPSPAARNLPVTIVYTVWLHGRLVIWWVDGPIR